MNPIRVYAILIRQLLLLRHNLTRFSTLFLWTALDIVLWGFITKYFDAVGQAPFRFATVLLGALILWNFLVQAQQGVMRAFFEDMWSRNFINLFASPLTIREYTVGLILTSTLTSILGLAVMIVLASVGFGFTFFKLGMLFFPFLLILFLFGIALGVFTIALVLRLGQSAEWLAWPIPFILAPFVGVFYPVSSLPSALQTVAKFLPPSYVFEGMRGVLNLGEFSWLNLGMGAVTAMLSLILAYMMFVAVYKSAVSSGMLARFNTEDT